MRVLVVDDDAAVRDSLARTLRFEGHEVDTACDGQEALDVVRAGEPDAMILDVSMPTMDGLEACRRLRADGVLVPVLMVTARDSVGDRVPGVDGAGVTWSSSRSRWCRSPSRSSPSRPPPARRGCCGCPGSSPWWPSAIRAPRPTIPPPSRQPSSSAADQQRGAAVIPPAAGRGGGGRRRAGSGAGLVPRGVVGGVRRGRRVEGGGVVVVARRARRLVAHVGSPFVSRWRRYPRHSP
ncbi:response regulator [Actinoplanes sp. NPDC051475]|uniref:response regulator transcription factor n=1 Tax=Actinoplanes sp. NPDC051475 TaxID=3157225 RepID=UPI00344DBB53